MASELVLRHTATGATINAIVYSGATRWNNSALVAASTISDGAWATGAVSCTEQANSSSTATKVYVGSLPAISVSGQPIPITVYYFEGTPTAGQDHVGVQSFWWDGSQPVPPPNVNTSGHVSRVVLADTVTTLTGHTAQTGDAYRLLVADKYLDTSGSPWALVYMVKGSGGIGVGTEILREELFTASGTAVTSYTQLLGRAVE